MKILAAGVIRNDLEMFVYQGVHYAARRVTDGWMMFIDGKCIGLSSKNPADYIKNYVAQTTESG